MSKNKRKIIGLRRFNSERRRKLKKRLMEKYEGKCCYCGSTKNLTTHHKIPLSKGGENVFSNFVLACYTCNHTIDDSIEEPL